MLAPWTGLELRRKELKENPSKKDDTGGALLLLFGFGEVFEAEKDDGMVLYFMDLYLYNNGAEEKEAAYEKEGINHCDLWYHTVHALCNSWYSM